eukprot:XP_763257.1 hypothetical protein [Theileria parva strain Muguga]
MEKALNEFSLLWNDVGIFNDISKITNKQKVETEEVRKLMKYLFQVKTETATHQNDDLINDISKKWNLEAFEKNDEMIRLHENILNNLSELTIREISLHSNFKTLNENYNNLLNLQSQLNSKIKKVESIYSHYSNMNLVNEFNNNFFNINFNDSKLLCQFLTKVNEMLVLIVNSINFFTLNNYYKSEVYKNKYQQQLKTILYNIKLLFKFIFKYHVRIGQTNRDLNSESSSLEFENSPELINSKNNLVDDDPANDVLVIKILKLMNKIMLNMNNDDDVIQIKLYYINNIVNSQLKSTSFDLDIEKNSESDSNPLLGEIKSLINKQFLYYNILFENVIIEDKEEIITLLVNNIKSQFNYKGQDLEDYKHFLLNNSFPDDDNSNIDKQFS